MTGRSVARSALRLAIFPRWPRLAGGVLLTLALTVPAASLAQTNPDTRRAGPSSAVRPTGPRAAYTLQRGLELCPTIRALVAELNHSDVIVYVAIRPRETGPAATIAFLGASAPARFVRVVLRSDLTTKQMIVLIGHELRHALEVARAPEVRDAVSFDTHYRCDGLRTLDPNRFDTRSAVLAGERVRQELALAGVRR
jgi:hypothetical protein